MIEPSFVKAVPPKPPCLTISSCVRSNGANMITGQTAAESEMLEIRCLLNYIFETSGYDLRNYAYASLRQRLKAAAFSARAGSIAEFHQIIRGDGKALQQLLSSIATGVTGLFRDPDFYAAVRKKVVPILRTYPSIDIWHAGCATGEEVYSMAILLKEEGLYDKCRLYATDMNESMLQKAHSGVFSSSLLQHYNDNYQKSGGKETLSLYFRRREQECCFSESLKKRIVFGQHNLVTDSSFKEFQLIACRNVMIYFNKQLQERVFRLLHESLCSFGVLGLGRGETLKFSKIEEFYEPLDARQKLYRRLT